MYDLTYILDIHNSFDIITGRGKLFFRGAVAVYQTGFSVMLVNGKLIKSDYPVIRKKGELLLPDLFIRKIINEFYPGYEISEKQGSFFIRKKISPDKPDINDKTDYPKGSSIPSSTKDRISFIIIDPGHGGKDPGAIGKGGLKEKWITLQISKHVEKYLSPRLKNVKIKLTRNTDKFIELEERTKIANRILKKNENGLFISIHVNASILSKISGFETYFLSQNPSNEEARTTAALENNVIILEKNKRKNKNYNDVEHVEAIMLNTQILKESSMLADFIQKNMDRNISKSKSKGVKKADFYVLRGSLMPAVLVEVGFISNKTEANRLKQYDYQKKIAKGIGEGIINFIKEYNKNI
ncbi:MAG: N-acetylmuramoyl-L-alanine amidase [Spirochaetes bacterium]|nr:N-acetylmuramoyl-L-alanine amidase [Spirochaetota bacterium]